VASHRDHDSHDFYLPAAASINELPMAPALFQMIICQPLVETPAQHEPITPFCLGQKIGSNFGNKSLVFFTKERRAPSSSVEWES